METDPPTDALEDAIGHGNEVAGLNNYGKKAAGYGLNEDRGEASGGEASLPKPKPNSIYNTVVFIKRKKCLSRHNKGQKNMTSHPEGLLLVFIMPMPRRLILPLWLTTNSETATVVLKM